MTAVLITQEGGFDRADSSAREPTLANRSHNDNSDKPGKRVEIRAEAIPAFSPGHAGEDHQSASTTIDPQSLPIEERIDYYRSAIKNLASAESFREEVLYQVFSHLLEKSLREHAAT